MDTRTANGAHPAFVEMIRQLTPDEARLLRLLVQPRPFPLLNVRREYKVQDKSHRGGNYILVHFSLLGWEAGCALPELTPTYLDNLCRLGLTDVPAIYEYTSPGIYDPLEQHPDVEAVRKALEGSETWKIQIEHKGLLVTELGKQFCRICVISHDQIGLPTKAIGQQ